MDMSKWEDMFGRKDDDGPIPIDPDNAMYEYQEPPLDDHPLVFAVSDGDTFTRHETGLRVMWINQECVCSFGSFENAVDCLRVLERSLSMYTEDVDHDKDSQ